MLRRVVEMSLRHHLLVARALGPNTQRSRTTTHATIACTRHVALALVKLCAVDLCTTKTLASVFGTSNRPSVAVAESDASVVRHACAVEVGPLWQTARRAAVTEAAAVGPGGVGRRWRRGGRGGRVDRGWARRRLRSGLDEFC